MKVILVNGSPKPAGCTFTALGEIQSALENNGIQTEIFQLGTKPISGCIDCKACRNNNAPCPLDNLVKDFSVKAKSADALVFGSPVHYAAASGGVTSFMDRLFFSNPGAFKGKVGAAIVSCRRAGSTAAIDQLNKYFSINQMPIASSQYWPMVHGYTPDDVRQDAEGMQTMRVLGNNIAWMLKCIDAGKKAGITFPDQEKREWTNFIR